MSFKSGSMHSSMGTRAGFTGGVSAGPQDPTLLVDTRPSNQVLSGDPRGSQGRQVVDTSGRGFEGTSGSVVLGPRTQRRTTTIGSPTVTGTPSGPATQPVAFVRNLSASTGLPESAVLLGLLGIGLFLTLSVLRR